MLARGIREIHSRSRWETGLAGIGWEKSAFIPFEISSNPCQSCFPLAPVLGSGGVSKTSLPSASFSSASIANTGRVMYWA